MAQPSIGRRTETLEYIESMLRQLRAMAETERCDMLVYLIEMACIEAGDAIRAGRPARSNHSKAHDAR